MKTWVGAVVIRAHDHRIEQGLATLTIADDETWSGSILLEGNGEWFIGDERGHFTSGDSYSVQAVEGGAVSTFRIMTVRMGGERNSEGMMMEAVHLEVEGAKGSAPPG